MDLIQAKALLKDDLPFQAIADAADGVLQKLKLNHDAKVLDVGTGEGNMAVTLALNGYEVITGEPEDDDSIYSKKNWAGKAEALQVDHLITFQPFKAENMPFEDGRFDAVFLFGCFHHMPEKVRPAVIRECLRTTTPFGTICFFEPTESTVDFIRKYDPDHPDPVDPETYTRDYDLTAEKKPGDLFNAFIFRKTVAEKMLP